MNRLRRPAAVSLLTALACLALAAPAAAVPRAQAVEAADRDAKVVEQRRLHPGLESSARRVDGSWEVAYFAGGEQVALAVVDQGSGEVRESWTGYQVAWKMARGYEGAFGHKLNAPYVFLPLCALFLLGLLDWRRPLRIANLDLLVLLGLGVSHLFFNRGEIGVSVPLQYPVLLYLLGRALWIGFRGGGPGLRPVWPAAWLLVAALFLLGVRVGLNVADSGVIDVGYASVVGGDRILSGEAVYDNFPADVSQGDTYGPATYLAYAPFALVWPWSGGWDDLPAAHAAAVVFDVGAFLLLVLLGTRLRPGAAGRRLGAILGFGWAAYPYTAFALESNSNDSLVALLLTATLLALSRPAARGALLGLATMAKLAPSLLAPLLLTYRPEQEPTLQPAGEAPEAPGAAGGETPREVPGGEPEESIREVSVGGVRERKLRPQDPTNGHPAKPLLAHPSILFALAFAAVCLALLAWPALDPGLATVFDRTLGYQAGRDSPFSIWGQAPSLEPLRPALLAATAGLSLLCAFRPRRKSPRQVAALGAALLIALQLTMQHWFYLYVVWFLPLLLVALCLARPCRETRT